MESGEPTWEDIDGHIEAMFPPTDKTPIQIENDKPSGRKVSAARRGINQALAETTIVDQPVPGPDAAEADVVSPPEASADSQG